MTNNINQQKFNVLLKNPKDSAKIMTQVDPGGRKNIWFLSEKKNQQRALDLAPGSTIQALPA